MPRDLPTNPDTFRNLVRLYIRDREPYNTLLEGVETTDEQIDLSVLLALGDFNITPPIIGNFTYSSFPSTTLLLYGTVIQILVSAGILQSRNQLDYSDGGLTVAVSNKTSLYQSWLQYLTGMWEGTKKNLKISMNIENGWGGVYSEYSLVNYGGGTFYNFGTSGFGAGSLF